MEELKTYKAVYADEEFEVFSVEDDEEAFEMAYSYEKEHGDLFDLFEVDFDSFDEIRIIF